MEEFRRLIEIQKDIDSQISTNKGLTAIFNRINSPFASLKDLDIQIKDIETKLNEEKDEIKRTLLKLRRESLIKRYDEIKKSITSEMEKELVIARKNLEVGIKTLEEFQKELTEAKKYWAAVQLRSEQTIAKTTIFTDFLSVEGKMTINAGQTLEILTPKPVENNLYDANVYAEESFKTIIEPSFTFIKVGQLNKNLSGGEIKKVNLDKILIYDEEGNKEMVYSKFTFNTNLTINLSSLGVILNDYERMDGDGSVWILVNNGCAGRGEVPTATRPCCQGYKESGGKCIRDVIID